MFSPVILAFHSSSKSLLCYVAVCLPCDRPLCLTQNTYLSLLSPGLLYTSLRRNSSKNLTKTKDKKKNHFLVPGCRMTWLHSCGSVDPDFRDICCDSDWVRQNKSQDSVIPKKKADSLNQFS